MRTIQIPTSKLIKYIPSEPDGGVIPGKVLFCDSPELIRKSAYEFELQYVAHGKSVRFLAACKLDEELEMVNDSNVLVSGLFKKLTSLLIDDGVHFLFLSRETRASWGSFAGHHQTVLTIPDPFDALGAHQLSNFVRFGLSHIACCETGHGIHLAIITKDANRFSDRAVVTSQIGPDKFESLTFGPPCQHNVGWLIPWASKSKGINIAWLEDTEMDQFVSQAQPLLKV